MRKILKSVVVSFFSLGILSLVVIVTGCGNTLDECIESRNDLIQSSNHINPVLEEFLIENGLSPFSRSSIGPNDPSPVLPEVVELYDPEKNLTMQAIQTMYEGVEVVVGAYHSGDEENSQLLMITETESNKFLIMSEEGEPLLEFIYDTETKIATCVDVINGKRVQAYLCNGAMAVLGWEVSIIMAVPSGGSSLLFAVLWGVVTTAYCG